MLFTTLKQAATTLLFLTLGGYALACLLHGGLQATEVADWYGLLIIRLAVSAFFGLITAATLPFENGPLVLDWAVNLAVIAPAVLLAGRFLRNLRASALLSERVPFDRVGDSSGLRVMTVIFSLASIALVAVSSLQVDGGSSGFSSVDFLSSSPAALYAFAGVIGAYLLTCLVAPVDRDLIHFDRATGRAQEVAEAPAV